MAKQVSAIRIQGTFQDVTYVSSATYGNHTRAKRGTHKPAPVNASLKKESKTLVMSNVPAKVFKDAIDPYRGKIRGGTLWQRLVSTFRAQMKEDGEFDFTKLPPIDIHERHPLSRFLNVHSSVSVEKNSKLKIEIRYDAHPTFKKVRDIDGYIFTVIGVFPDQKKKKASTTTSASSVLPLKGPISPLLFQVDVPPKATEYIICLRLEGCVKGVVDGRQATIALCAIDAGNLKQESVKRKA